MAKKEKREEISEESELIAMSGKPISCQRGGISKRVIKGTVGYDEKGCFIKGKSEVRPALMRLDGNYKVNIDGQEYQINYFPKRFFE